VYLRGEGSLSVEITDIMLRPVASFRTGALPAGWNAVPFSLPSGEPSGTYLFIVTGARERRWSRVSWMR
jgi:hypothetical protein